MHTRAHLHPIDSIAASTRMLSAVVRRRGVHFCDQPCAASTACSSGSSTARPTGRCSYRRVIGLLVGDCGGDGAEWRRYGGDGRRCHDHYDDVSAAATARRSFRAVHRPSWAVASLRCIGAERKYSGAAIPFLAASVCKRLCTTSRADPSESPRPRPAPLGHRSTRRRRDLSAAQAAILPATVPFKAGQPPAALAHQVLSKTPSPQF